jgi:hypothetical protein
MRDVRTPTEEISPGNAPQSGLVDSLKSGTSSAYLYWPLIQAETYPCLSTRRRGTCQIFDGVLLFVLTRVRYISLEQLRTGDLFFLSVIFASLCS